MPTLEEVRDWQGRDLRGEGEKKIGEITGVYIDRTTGEPEWLAVKTGLFGTSVSFVPIAPALPDRDHVDVPFTKELVKDAPNAEADGELSPEQERRLYEHYGVAWGEFDYDAEHETEATVGHDTSGRTTDSAMTRSEEEMVVGTRKEETGRARLRKHVVTEDVQKTVPVSREEVRIEREPISEGNVDQAMDGPAVSDEEHEVTLHAEEPVVEKRVVPKERVRLGKETVLEEQTVSGEVRREEIETDASRR